MFFDPVYWIVILAGMALSGVAAARVRSTFNRYSRIPVRSGMTGAQVAERILADNGIKGVRVERVAGRLSDHYDPRNKILRLSDPVYSGRSMAAFGVAAHEVGHAIQDARGYAFLRFRSWWVPIAGIGSNVGILLLVFGVILAGTANAADDPSARPLLIAGIVLFACSTVFTLVTLPVEFNASKRALACLEQGGYMTQDEHRGAKAVLDAAAMTYVAAFITSLMMLLYWLFRSGLLGGRSD